MTASLSQQSQATVWSFGPYCLDGDGHLTLGPSAVALSPLQRRLLVSLVRHAGRVLEKETLLQEVWGHTQVSDVSLARAVHGLRRILGRGPLGPNVIRTIYGSGYRFDIAVSQRPGAEPAGPIRAGADFPSSQALVHFVEGLVQVRHRDPLQLPRAEQHFRECLKTTPNFGPALVQLAATQLARYQWGQLSAAAIETEVERLLSQAEASGSVPDQVLALRVEVLTLLNWQAQLVEERFASWLPDQLTPGAPLHSWVRHLLATGRATEAMALMEPQLTPDTPSGWLLAGQAKLQLGQIEGAMAMLRSQLRFDASMRAPRLLLSLILAQLNRSHESLQELSQCPMHEAKQGSLNAMHAHVFALCGERERAQSLLKSALRTRDQDLNMTSIWGLVAVHLGDESVGSRLLEQAVRSRCGLAPFVLHWPGLQRYDQSAAVGAFRTAMAPHFDLATIQ